jgi:hypothetical protein
MQLGHVSRRTFRKHDIVTYTPVTRKRFNKHITIATHRHYSRGNGDFYWVNLKVMQEGPMVKLFSYWIEERQFS